MIKNIILDFGDVLINLDKAATARAMMAFGIAQVDMGLAETFQAFEKGELTSQEFLKTVSRQFPGTPIDELTTAWNAILLDFPEHRLEFLEELAESGHYKLLLLSNTNALHMERVRQQMGNERFQRFRGAFDAFYLSHEMGMRKPDREIFEYVLAEQSLLPEQTLFVDDLPENTRAASALGIRVWNLQLGREDITQLKSRLHP